LHIPPATKNILKNWKMFNMRQGFQKEGAIKPFIKTFCDILAFRHLTLNGLSAANVNKHWEPTGGQHLAGGNFCQVVASVFPVTTQLDHEFCLFRNS